MLLNGYLDPDQLKIGLADLSSREIRVNIGSKPLLRYFFDKCLPVMVSA